MQSKVSFDFMRAKSMLDTLSTCKVQYTAALDEVKRGTVGMQEWWEGESYHNFIDRYNRKINEMDTCLARMDDVTSYITKVSNSKDDLEKRCKNRFK